MGLPQLTVWTPLPGCSGDGGKWKPTGFGGLRELRTETSEFRGPKSGRGTRQKTEEEGASQRELWGCAERASRAFG